MTDQEDDIVTFFNKKFETEFKKNQRDKIKYNLGISAELYDHSVELSKFKEDLKAFSNNKLVFIAHYITSSKWILPYLFSDYNIDEDKIKHSALNSEEIKSEHRTPMDSLDHPKRLYRKLIQKEKLKLLQEKVEEAGGAIQCLKIRYDTRLSEYYNNISNGNKNATEKEMLNFLKELLKITKKIESIEGSSTFTKSKEPEPLTDKEKMELLSSEIYNILKLEENTEDLRNDLEILKKSGIINTNRHSLPIKIEGLSMNECAETAVKIYYYWLFNYGGKEKKNYTVRLRHVFKYHLKNGDSGDFNAGTLRTAKDNIPKIKKDKQKVIDFSDIEDIIKNNS